MESTEPRVSNPESDGGAASPTHSEPLPHHHLKSRRQLPPDVIDLMDDSVPPSLLRHHSGPFDAVTKSTYLPKNKSPLAALEHSTQEALNATPETSIRDSLNKHVPLQNTAVVGPGEHIPGGRPNETLPDYKEENLLGDVGRWEGIEYDDDDRRAKGHAGWDGAFVNLGRNEIERAKYDSAHHHKKGRNSQEWGEYVDRPAAYVGDDSMIEVVPFDGDIRVSGMQASASAVEADAAEREKHHGIVDGIKRRLSLKKHH